MRKKYSMEYSKQLENAMASCTLYYAFYKRLTIRRGSRFVTNYIIGFGLTGTIYSHIAPIRSIALVTNLILVTKGDLNLVSIYIKFLT